MTPDTEIVEAVVIPDNPWQEVEMPAIAAPEAEGKHRRDPGDSGSITDDGRLSRDDSEAPEAEPKHAKRGRPRNRRITDAVPPSSKRSGEKPVPPPKVRAPDFSEWHDYLGNFAIKWITRGYVAFVFRGVDRYELLSDQDNQALELDDEQLSDVAKPLAHLANRSKIATKYGRVVIDSSDGVIACIQLGMWGSRVNRIARKYRETGKQEIISEHASTAPGEDVPGTTEEYRPVGTNLNGSRAPGVGYN